MAGRAARAGATAGAAALGSAATWITTPRPTRRRTRAEVDRSTRRRVIGVAVAIVALLVAALLKVVVIDTAQRGRLVAYANAQRFSSVAVPAPRGTIFDRSGRELAMTVQRPSLIVDPSLVPSRDRLAVARRLAPVLGLSEAAVLTKLRQPNRFQYLGRDVSARTRAQVRRLGEGERPWAEAIRAAVYEQGEPARRYPAGRSAAPVLGGVDAFGEARGGVEQMVDEAITGRNGSVRTKVDIRGREIPNAGRHVAPARAGQDVVLTIDANLQYQTEQALLHGVDAAKATGGTAVAVDLRDGSILAMATAIGNLLAPAVTGQPAPVTAPARLARSTEANRPLTDAYEPGSVSKLIPFAGAIEDGRIGPDTVFPKVPWRVAIPGTTPVRFLKDDEEHPDVDLSAIEVLTHSSNNGTRLVAQALGDRRLDYYLRAFGYGHTTDIGFPNEAAGYLPSVWNSSTPYSLPVGMGLSVTPMQVLQAYMTIANGGRTLHPRLIGATIDAAGERHDLPVVRGDRVVSARTARTLTQMLTHVVAPKPATGGKAAVPGYTVAGKTGTARHALGSGVNAYDSFKIHASFVGFAPAEAPRVAVIVVLDGQPQFDKFYGGDWAAPVFSSIMGSALRALHVPTTRDPLTSQARTGPLTVAMPAGPAGAVGAATVDTPVPSKPTQ
ncbi:MAG: peptidoglycan D,D-transpeptidase FtsI family protein [Actinomycetes bacterium]